VKKIEFPLPEEKGKTGGGIKGKQKRTGVQKGRKLW
jgi:hypothetical protein